MRVLLVPLPLPILDPMTDVPTGIFFSFAEFGRALFLHPNISQMGDVLTLMDLRARVSRAPAESEIELDEASWQTLCVLARQPAAIKPEVLPSIALFVRAVLEAKVKA